MNRLTWIKDTDPPDWFPPAELALNEPAGLLAAGGDLSPKRLLAGYRRGIFPWYSLDQPILWWSPDPRAVLFPQDLKVSRSFAKNIRNKGFTVTVNQDFLAVIGSCADPNLRTTGTWITSEMQTAYLTLYELGYAYSVETWLEGKLVGGLYGVRIGRVFFGESMFSRAKDASKIALRALCTGILGAEISLIDCQMATPHLLSLGVRTISRKEFLKLLALFLGNQ